LELAQLHTVEGVEYRAGDTLIGRLVWLDARSGERQAGWWLEVPFGRAELLYEAPNELPLGLGRARRQSQSAAEGFAELMLSDRAAGLLDLCLA
jgi:hypothetical protein